MKAKTKRLVSMLICCAMLLGMLPMTAFAISKYNVYYDANGGQGTMNGDQIEYNGLFKLDECGFTAPDGQRFVAWAIGSPNGEQKQPGDEVTIAAETTIYAIWEENGKAKTYTVTASASPAEGGTVTGGGEYAENTQVTVTATANEGYEFVNWSEGDVSVSTDASFTFTATANRNLYAKFREVYTIAVSANPAEGGTVTGGGTYAKAKDVTVSASENAGYEFVNWTEDGKEVSTDKSFGFIAAGNRNLVANFELKQPTVYTIKANASPAEGGTVTGGGEYAENTQVTVTATANEGYEFVNWSEGDVSVSTDASFTFTATANRSLYAKFREVYTIAVSAAPAEGGTVTGGGTYAKAKDVTVSASENAGYEFVNWTEDGTEVSTNKSFTFTAAANRNLVANFKTDVTAPATTSVSGTKTWVGDEEADRPESIIVNLLANGEAIDEAEVTVRSQWTFYFSDLPKYDKAGEEIEYSVEEEEVDGYTATYDGYNITNTLKEEDTPSHNPVKQWNSNETHHWNDCSVDGCDEKFYYDEHEDEDGDDICDVCETEMPAEEPSHTPESEWNKDETHHWHDCTVDGCDEKFDNAEHKDENSDSLCDSCGYDMSVPETDIAGGSGIGLEGPYMYESDIDQMLTEGEAKSVFEYGEPVYYLVIDESLDSPLSDYKYVEKLKAKAKWSAGEDLVESVKVVKKFVDVTGDGADKHCARILIENGFESGYYYFLEVAIADKVTVSETDFFGTVEFNRKKDSKKGVERIKDCTVEMDFTVFYPNNWNLEGTIKDDRAHIEWDTAYALKFDYDDEVELTFGSPSGGDNEGSFTVDISGQGKLYLYYTTEVDESVCAANEGAKIDFLTFRGLNGKGVKFNRAGEFRYEVEDGAYAYRVVDGKLIEMPGCYDESEDAFVFSTSVLESYVFSDTQLVLPEAE